MLSIIISTLNERENIKRLLNLLRHQVRKCDEIIIVDGFSTDGTAEISRNLGAKVILQEPRGIGGAKTEGARQAKNDILVFLDADCVLADDFLQRIGHHFNKNRIDAAGDINYYEASSSVMRFLYDTYTNLAFYIPLFLHKITRKYGLPANNVAYRRDIFFSVGGFRSVIGEDFDMMLRLPPSEKVIFDSRLIVRLSDRRFRQKGFLRTIILWLWYGSHLLIGRGLDAKDYGNRQSLERKRR